MLMCNHLKLNWLSCLSFWKVQLNKMNWLPKNGMFNFPLGSNSDFLPIFELAAKMSSEDQG